jgi:uncharacterized protein
MGHRHTSEEQGGECAVCGPDGGSAAAFVESVESLPSGVQQPFGAQGKAASLHGIGVRLALFGLRFYKAYLSMLFAGSCRFDPTCSRYAYEALERFGVGRGSWLALKRLGRCQPFSRKFGYDPVPKAWDDAHFAGVASEVSDAAAAHHEVHT